MSYFRENIARMSVYAPGEQPPPGEFIKLNTNENPYPPSPKVLKALKDAVNDDLRLYPDPVASHARRRIAETLGATPERILLGNGSDDILTIIFRSFVDEGETIVLPYPTYFLYETLADIQNARFVHVDFTDDYSLPPRLARADGKLMFIANPNSPSGTIVPVEEVANVAREFKGIVVVDEAYADFADFNCLQLVEELDNVIIMRTLSKSFSLAGMRIGFAIAQEDLIAGMCNVKDSYNVDRLCIVAAAAAFDDIDYMRRNVEKIKSTRRRLTSELRRMGVFVFPSQSNFVLARFGSTEEAERIYLKLKDRKILVRYFNRRKVDDCLRISVGADGEIDSLLKNLAEIRNQVP